MSGSNDGASSAFNVRGWCVAYVTEPASSSENDQAAARTGRKP
ncbi:hypothetical protein [Streptomyces atroolivaceus]